MFANVKVSQKPSAYKGKVFAHYYIWQAGPERRNDVDPALCLISGRP